MVMKDAVPEVPGVSPAVVPPAGTEVLKPELPVEPLEPLVPVAAAVAAAVDAALSGQPATSRLDNAIRHRHARYVKDCFPKTLYPLPDYIVQVSREVELNISINY